MAMTPVTQRITTVAEAEQMEQAIERLKAENAELRDNGDEIKRGQVRQAGNSRYYIGGSPSWDSEDYETRYTSPQVPVVEVEGRWVGAKFVVAASVVQKWPLVRR